MNLPLLRSKALQGDTSHAIAETGNRQALEVGRPALEQGGGSLQFAEYAIRHALMVRRILSGNTLGFSIYKQKHPTLEPPEVRPFMSAVTFRPSTKQEDKPKMGPRGRDGILLGWPVNPRGVVDWRLLVYSTCGPPQ